MMKLACKDLSPNSSCSFEATGSSASEVTAKMMAHAKTDHPEDLAGKSDTEAMSWMESMVHE